MTDTSIDVPADVILDYTVDLMARAKCETCSYETSPSSMSRARALHHVQTKNHRVRIMTETIEFWQPAPREEPENDT